MIADLINSMFYEAEIRTRKSGNKAALSKDIHLWIYDHLIDENGSRVSVSIKTIERIYDQFILKTEETLQRGDPKKEFLNYFSQYLDYDSYEDYILKNSGEKTNDSEKSEKATIEIAEGIITESVNVDSKVINTESNVERDQINNIDNSVTNTITHNHDSKKGRLILFISIFTAIVVTIIVLMVGFKDDSLCLVWRQNHYEKIDCDQISSSDITISVDEKQWNTNYKEFKKITINESTPLVKSDGKPLVWYHVNDNRFEFYNANGTHPVSGKKLKPITYDVAKKYFEQVLEKKPEEVVEPVSVNHTESADTSLPSSTETDAGSEKELEKEEVILKGKYCFKNTSSKTMHVYLEPNTSSSKKIETMELKPNEQICVYIPIGSYKYNALLKHNNSFIEKGNIRISENQEGYLSLSLPVVESIPEVDEPEPVVEKECLTGNYKVINNSNEKLEIRLSDFGINGPLASFFKTIHVQPGKSGSFFGIKGGVYVLEITRSNDHMNTEKMNIQIENCKTIEFGVD